MTARGLVLALAAAVVFAPLAVRAAEDLPSGAALNNAIADRLAKIKKEAQRKPDSKVEPPVSGVVIPPTAVTGVARAETGDTLSIGIQRFRIWGIAAPRLDEFGGYTAQQGLFALLNGAKTSCAALGPLSEEGLPIARCVADGRDLGDELVLRGLARDCPRQSQGTYAATERQAVIDVAGGFDLPPECLED